jgi:hypothetical protein
MTKIATVDEYVTALPTDLRAAAGKLVEIIDEVLPGTGAMWHGHPVWSLGAAPGKDPVCLIKAYPAYVTFGIWPGRDLTDESRRLDTKGGMAHVKIRSLADVDADLFTRWLTEARTLVASA